MQLPLLQASSPSPSILLISSLAALVPPPTRALYASTKAASLLFYQTLAIEHPAVAFSHCIPGTVKGNFRASAVDGVSTDVGKKGQHGLEQHIVAKRCVQGVDGGERLIFMPWWYSRGAHALYWIFPPALEDFARRKYNFSP